MNKSKNNHDNLNEGGKQVINDPDKTEIIANNNHTNPEQYQEKVGDGIRMNEQPLKQDNSIPDDEKALEAGDK